MPEPGRDARNRTFARASEDHHAGLWSGLVRRADALTATVGTEHNDLHARHVLVEFLDVDALPEGMIVQMATGYEALFTYL